MVTEKEEAKVKIKELSAKIKDEEEDYIWEDYEHQIARLIIDYSLHNNIRIPLINYDLYQNDENLEEPYDYWNPFLEAIGEHTVTNPRFVLHPEIMELVMCWNVE